MRGLPLPLGPAVTAPSANDLFRECQRLVRLGQPVFPCFTQGEKAKRPMTKNGWKDASLDVDQIKRWWRNHRDAAIGIPTGILWDVLDVDIKNGVDGRKHIYGLQQLGYLNGCRFVVRTPGGGLHLYFDATPSLTNKGRAGTMGLDVRAKGGYVLAPPSWISTPEYSGAYENTGPTEGGNHAPLLWDGILANLCPTNEDTNKPITLLPSERRASVAHLREWVTTLVKGERNNGFHWAVSRCIENGIDPNELMEVALLIGLGEEEVGKTINSALTRAGVLVEELDSEAEAMFPDDED